MKKILIGFALALMASGAAHAADLGGKLLKVGSDTTSPPMETNWPTTVCDWILDASGAPAFPRLCSAGARRLSKSSPHFRV